ncbi:MAG: hypothetical protein KDA72_05050, partial [Planctomycetales bacterium]|nr:hypothetical protein [Planctomycetales bacterium]
MRSRLWLALVCLAFSGLGLIEIRSMAESPELPPDERLRLTGKVTDMNGAPIVGAEVRLIAPKQFGLPHETYGSVAVSTDATGEFALQVRAEDRRFMQGYHCKAMLVVRASNFELSASAFHLTRCLVDAPLSIQLRPATSLAIQVFDSNGQSLADIAVRPAKIGEHQLPFAEVVDAQATTDSAGIAHFNGLPSVNLERIYLVGKQIGYQCVTPTKTDAGLTAVALSTQTRSGQLTAKANALYAMPDLSTISLQLVSSIDELRSVYTWSESPVDAQGEFLVEHICDGRVIVHSHLPEQMSYELEPSLTYSGLKLTDGRYQLELLPANRVLGRVIESDSGEGLPRITISHTESRGHSSVSDQEGNFTFWAGAGRISYFPSHSLGSYSLDTGFYLSPQELPEDGQLQLEPVQLKRMTSAVGRVVNSDGQPLAGIEIQCRTKTERFTDAVSLWSDRNGNFRFFGITNGKTLSLSAQSISTDSQFAQLLAVGTRRPLSLQVYDDARPELILEPLPTAYFSGTVVDGAAQPVADAVVVVRQAKVFQEEAYGGSDRAPEPLFRDDIVTSDHQGRFRTPHTTNFAQDVSVSIKSAGYETFNSGWSKHKPSGADGTQIELGQHSLLTEPANIAVQVTVRGAQTGKPLSNSRVVFLGAKSGLVKQHLEAGEPTSLTVKQSPQVIAAMADGYQPQFRCIDNFEPNVAGNYEIDFELGHEPNQNRTVASRDAERMRTAARELLAPIPEPLLAASYHQLIAYYSCTTFTQPSQLVDRIKVMKLAGADLNILQGVVHILVRLPQEEIRRLLPLVNNQVKVFLFTSMVDQATTAEQREEMLGEALIAVRQLGGDDQLMAYSNLSCTMLKHGMLDSALEVIGEAWDEHAEIREIIGKGQRLERSSRKQGIARYFAQPLALLHREEAF